MIYVPKANFMLFDGRRRIVFRKGVTTIRSGHRLYVGREKMFEPIHVEFDVETVEKSEKVDAQAVREWAVDNDIDVPARGRIPAGIVERYRTR